MYIYRERERETATPCYTYTDTYNVYGVQEILSSFGHRPSASSKHPPNQSVTMTHFDIFVTYIHTNLNHHTIQITSKKLLAYIYIYVCVYICTYIEGEREREIYIYMWGHIYSMIYIIIYIYTHEK